MTVSLTRLRLRSLLYLPGFAYYTIPTLREIRSAPGFLDGALLPDAHLTFWTLTRWTGEDSLKRWRGAGAHGRSMPRLAGWCDEAGVVRWDEPDAGTPRPSWFECHERLLTEGRRSPVRFPSPDQQANTLALPDPSRIPRSFAFTHTP